MSGVGDSFARVVTDGPFVVAALVAAVAGLVSFLSPCVLPLVPGYLSYVGGLSGTEAAARTRRRSGRRRQSPPGPGCAAGPCWARCCSCSASPSCSSRTACCSAGWAALLIEHQRLLERILGVVVILLGLAFLGWLPGVSRELRIHRFPSAGLAGAPLLGIVFGLGWTPCIGPTLGAVQSLALSTAGAGRGAALSAAYCIGLGVPFVLVAIGARWLVRALGVVRRHANVVTYVGGGLLVVLGLLLVTGLWGEMTIELTSRVGQTGLGTSL